MHWQREAATGRNDRYPPMYGYPPPNQGGLACFYPTNPRTQKYRIDGPIRHPKPVWNVAVSAP